MVFLNYSNTIVFQVNSNTIVFQGQLGAFHTCRALAFQFSMEYNVSNNS